MLDNQKYSLKEFQQDTTSLQDFNRHLAKDTAIRRGFPEDLAHFAPVMKTLILQQQVFIRHSGTPEQTLSTLKEAHRFGYVDLNSNDCYVFASPLSRQVWSWYLLPSPTYELPYPDLFSFVVATVARFRPSQLTGSDRRVGDSDRRPPEAQYQEEYYRCVHEITDGNVAISPEFAAATGTRPGRIDFFIPSKKWGIEVTRDGSRLHEHASRFANDGAYGQWLESSVMLDYVLLDFRMTKPAQAHHGKRVPKPLQNIVLTYDWAQGIKNLYHVVFNSDATSLEIYDNTLSVRSQSNLMQRR